MRRHHFAESCARNERLLRLKEGVLPGGGPLSQNHAFCSHILEHGTARREGGDWYAIQNAIRAAVQSGSKEMGCALLPSCKAT